MKKIKKTRSSEGFTMIEIIIVILAIAILGGLTAEIIGNASTVYSTTLSKHEFLKEARYAFFKITREATWQKNHTSFSGSNNKRIDIRSADGKVIDFRIRNTNDFVYNNNQVPGTNNETITNKISYNNSEIYYLDESGNVTNVSTNSQLVKSIKLDFQFTDSNNSMRLTGYSLPYNLRIGRGMSYHE